MLRKSVMTLATGVVLLLGADRTHALLITEDFQAAGNPAVPGFDPVFNHRIGLDEFGWNSVFYTSFSTGRFTSEAHSLFLAPGTDYVTFNLGAGQYVDHVEVWMTSNQSSPEAYFHVIGTEGEMIKHVGGGFSTPLSRFDTLSANLGVITEIRLTGYEGYFDDLTISVVPEPTAICLLAIGILLLLRQGWRSRLLAGLAPLFFICADRRVIGRSHLPTR